MKLSDEGRRLIISFEGKLRKIEPGKYVAYKCPAGVWTVFAGCTEGVHEGMVVTEHEGEAMFARELEKFEAGVVRLVTVDLNQNEFDALVSLTYNIGLGAFQKSSVLRKINAGDRDGAAQAFHLWNKGGGRVLRGLVSRRQREAALFLKPIEQPGEPYMPQRVEASRVPPSRKVVGVGTAVVTSGTAVISQSGIPAPPPLVDSSTGAVAAWKTLATKAIADPLLLIGLGVVAAIFVVPWLLDKWRDA